MQNARTRCITICLIEGIFRTTAARFSSGCTSAFN